MSKIKDCQVKVSRDSSWKKRGFHSLFDVMMLIGYYSGKVVNLIVKSAHCQACVYWSKKQGTNEYIGIKDMKTSVLQIIPNQQERWWSTR